MTRDEILVRAYTTLIMGGKKSIDDVPEHLKEAVEMEKAMREIELLEKTPSAI